MEFPKRNPSFDITDDYTTRAPSPAPTYRSISPSTQPSPSIDSKPKQFSAGEKHTPFQPPKPDPFDPNHPHYAPPTNPYPPPPTPQPRVSRNRATTLLPWILLTIFFLTTLWYTTLAFGLHLFTSQHPLSTPNTSAAPLPPINIIINGEDHFIAPTATTPTPISITQAPVPGNGVDPDLGTDTITSKVGRGRREVPTARVGWVVVTRRGC